MGRGILSLPLVILADALHMPEGYQLVSAQYDTLTQEVRFLVLSEQIEDDPAASRLPQVYLMAQVDRAAPDSAYQKVTTWIERSA